VFATDRSLHLYDGAVQQPPAYPPQQPAPHAVTQPTNSLAIVSLVAGIASYFVVPVIGAIVAIVTGHMARGQIRRTGEGGGGLALAGLVLGYVHIALAVIVIGAVLIGLAIAGVGIFGQSTG
jgi:ABC-type transport system involved in cytochrome c biogenesis permease subunit